MGLRQRLGASRTELQRQRLPTDASVSRHMACAQRLDSSAVHHAIGRHSYWVVLSYTCHATFPSMAAQRHLARVTGLSLNRLMNPARCMRKKPSTDSGWPCVASLRRHVSNCHASAVARMRSTCGVQ